MALTPEPIRLELSDASVTIDAAQGGRLSSFIVGGRELLLGPDSTADRGRDSIDWGCFLMVPWAGRLEGGRSHCRGWVLQLPRHHGRRALHGGGFDKVWPVVRAGDRGVKLELDLGATAWPLGGTARQRIELTRHALMLEATVTADG